MKRLIKAELYEGFKCRDDHFEIFKNPTSNEIETVKKSYSLRGAITKNGDKYIWDGNILHSEINKFVENKVDTDYFTFTFDKVKWYSHLFNNNITKDECREVIKNNLDFFSQVGNLNKTFELIVGSDDLKFDSLNSFLNQENAAQLKLKRLIQSEIFNGFNFRDVYYEIYKNPTGQEIEDIKNNSKYKSVRGVILESGDVYIWSGEIIHSYVPDYIDINKFRFLYDNSTGWMFDANENYTLSEMSKMIIKYKDKLSKIGDLNTELYIAFAPDCRGEGFTLEQIEENTKQSVARLIKKSNEVELQVGDNVQLKRHPYDKSIYEVKEILPNGTLFLDNGETAHTNIKPSVVKPIE